MGSGDIKTVVEKLRTTPPNTPEFKRLEKMLNALLDAEEPEVDKELEAAWEADRDPTR